MRALHQAKNVGLSVGDINQAGLWHLMRRLGNPLIAFNSALAFKHAWAFAVSALGLACPHPGIRYAERLPVRRVDERTCRAGLRRRVDQDRLSTGALEPVV